MITLLALLALAAAPPVPLDLAKRHLAAGKLDEVLFELDGKTFSEVERPGAAAVLAEAARASLDANDLVLALQFAQMALRLEKSQPLALEIGARASLKQKQFDPAEDYADRLIAQAPKAAAPRLLRSEIALEEGEWAKVIALTRQVDPLALSQADRDRLLSLVQAASRELDERDASRAQARSLQDQLAVQMKKLENAAATARTLPVRAERPTVIVYGTDWCGYCRQAEAWLKARDIPYVARNIEKDPEALEELNAKKRAAGKARQGGVPWIDAGGELLTGFDVPALERLFPARRE